MRSEDFEIVAGGLVKYRGRESNVVIPDEVKCIQPLAFNGMSITSVVIPDAVEEIKYRAFADCSNLKAIGCITKFGVMQLESRRAQPPPSADGTPFVREGGKDNPLYWAKTHY